MLGQVSALALFSLSLVSRVSCTANSSSSYTSFLESNFDAANVITRDVAIVGGGSGGTYAALSLKDKNKSVVVIEKKNRIGGHTETYIDPATRIPIDIGVQIFHNTSVVRNYFARLNIPLTVSSTQSGGLAWNVDFTTGQQVNITEYSQEDLATALQTYATILAQYPALANGTFLPDPVPEDLYMPFKDFTTKYNLQAIFYLLFSYNPGLGSQLDVPTVEVMRVWGTSLVQQLSAGFLTTAHHNNSELYSNAQAELLADNSLLLEHQVTDSLRVSNSSSGVRLIVNGADGPKLIIAKKLLVAIPPVLGNVEVFLPTDAEKAVFSKWRTQGYYTGLLRNAGFPANLSISNRAPSTPYNIPHLPGIYSFSPAAAPGLSSVYYGTELSDYTDLLSGDDVQANIIADIQRAQKANGISTNYTAPEFAIFSDHSPFYLQVNNSEVQNGFYKSLYALQGQTNTWYTGAAFRAQDSSDIWDYTENHVIPELIKEL